MKWSFDVTECFGNRAAAMIAAFMTQSVGLRQCQLVHANATTVIVHWSITYLAPHDGSSPSTRSSHSIWGITVVRHHMHFSFELLELRSM